MPSPLYTPFMEKMGAKLGQGLADRSLNEQAGLAMQGDPQALKNLYGMDPALASKIETQMRARSTEASKAQQDLMFKLQTYRDDTIDMMKGAPDWENAQSIIDQRFEGLQQFNLPPELMARIKKPDEAFYNAMHATRDTQFATKVQMSDQLYIDESTGELYTRGTAGDPNVSEDQWTEQWLGVGHEGQPGGVVVPVSDEGLTVDQKTKLIAHREFVKAEAKGLGASEAEIASADRVGAARARIASWVTGAKINQQQLGKLKETRPARISNIDKAERFLKAFEEETKSSGIGQQALYFAPIGVWTSQGEFNEIFSAFTEIAARSALKASGEIRPTDADVTGMKRAMFGVGRSEAANIQLLKDYIGEQTALEARIGEIESGAATSPSTKKVNWGDM